MTAAEKIEPVQWELSGDQYELFPLPPGPSRMFRSLLGLPDPAPELLELPGDDGIQYEIFPQLAKALAPRPEPPPGMVDDSDLSKLQDVLNPGSDKLAGMLQLADEFNEDLVPPASVRQMPNFGDPED